MNHKPQRQPAFPRLASITGLACLAAMLVAFLSAGIADESLSPSPTAADEPAAGSQNQASPEESAKLPTADEILTQVRAKLEGLASLRCDLQQTALISGIKLTAFGKYVEASGNRVHLEYFIFPMANVRADDAKALALDAPAPELNEADNRGVLTQVSDGSVLYTSWKNGDTQRVTRRNIRDILAAAAATTTYDPQRAAMDLGVGGLRGLISRLQTTMEFAVVKTVSIGDRNFLEVTGRWNEKVRKDVFRLPEGSIVDPRPHVPEYVRVYVDSQTMLPRRIQFLKRSMDATAKMVRPLLTLDLRNLVVNEAVDDQVFTFQAPEKIQEEDLTEQVIQQIQASVQPPTAAPEK
jgi:hypothetical protein